MKLIKGDHVQVVAGVHRGQEGEYLGEHINPNNALIRTVNGAMIVIGKDKLECKKK